MTSPSSPRRRAAAVLLTLLCGAVAACEPAPPPPPPPPPAARAVATDLDTFAVSSQPTAVRVTDSVMRVMGSGGKTKIGLVSFPIAVADTATLSGTLALTPKQSGFAVRVQNAGPFSGATSYDDRPALGATVGNGSTAAGSRTTIRLTGVKVTSGRIHLALTTASLYELEVVSMEGAADAGTPAAVPTFTPGTATPLPPPPPGPAGWKLTFSDEFDGTRLDTSTWQVYDERLGHSVESPKASTCPLPSNVSVGGGKLVMRTQKANGACKGGQAQSGAGLNTWGTFKQAGGRFEARGRWTQKGNYLWGGFWTHGNGGDGWTKDNSNEIDIWEYIGKTGEPNINRFKPAIHYNYTCEGQCGMQNVPHMGYDVTAWHTYAIEWEPTVASDPTTMQIRFFLDGRQIALFDRHGTWRVQPDGTRVLVIAGGWKNPKGAFPNPFGLDRPQQIVLSAWVGAPGVPASTVAAGYRPAGGHADLEIDYVRVYRR